MAIRPFDVSKTIVCFSANCNSLDWVEGNGRLMRIHHKERASALQQLVGQVSISEGSSKMVRRRSNFWYDVQVEGPFIRGEIPTSHAVQDRSPRTCFDGRPDGLPIGHIPGSRFLTDILKHRISTSSRICVRFTGPPTNSGGSMVSDDLSAGSTTAA